MTSAQTRRAVTASLWLGLALTIAAVLVVYVDRATTNVLAEHIRSGYPSYSQAKIDQAANLYVVILTVIGILGVVGWLVALRATRSGTGLARWVVVSLFAIGTCIAVFMLTVRDTSGDTGLAPLHGWVGMLPSVAGLAAVILVWRKPGQSIEA